MTDHSTHPVRQTRRRVDDRWRLAPRSYVTVPALFGTTGPVTFHVPPGGSAAEMERARIVHRVFSTLDSKGTTVCGAHVGRRHGFSRSLWSACKAGKQWPPSTLLQAALLAAGI